MLTYRRWAGLAAIIVAAPLFIGGPVLLLLFGRDDLRLSSLAGLAVGLAVSGLGLWQTFRGGTAPHRMRPAAGQIALRTSPAEITGSDGTLLWRPVTVNGHIAALRTPDDATAYIVHSTDDLNGRRTIGVFGPDRRPLGRVESLHGIMRQYSFVIYNGGNHPRASLTGSTSDRGQSLDVSAYGGGPRLGRVKVASTLQGRLHGGVVLDANTPEPIRVLCALFTLEWEHMQLRMRR